MRDSQVDVLLPRLKWQKRCHSCGPRLSNKLCTALLADKEDAGASVYRLVRSAGGEAARAKLRIHHSSVLFRCRPAWVCFYAAQQNESGW